jgi:hypothetical protein
VLPDVEVEVSSLDVMPGDRFLLCSDGLSGVVDDVEIAAIVQSQSPQDAVDALVELANERGGPDNITVQVLAVASSDSHTDPEATAPAQRSKAGLEAIENRRRAHVVTKRAAIGALVVAVLAAAFLASRFLSAAGGLAPTDAPPARPLPSDADPASAGRDGESEVWQARPSADAPRRGLPR